MDFSFAPERAVFHLSLSKEMFFARNIFTFRDSQRKRSNEDIHHAIDSP